MIKHIEISNFKSIRHLELDCKKVNVLIGKPNTGKSNFLEALSVFCDTDFGSLGKFVRFESLSELFYQQQLKNKIVVRADNMSYAMEYKNDKVEFKLTESENHIKTFQLGLQGSITATSGHDRAPEMGVKPYKFVSQKQFISKNLGYLSPVHGENLLELLLSYNELAKSAAKLMEPFGFKLVVDRSENKIKFQREEERVVVSWPYWTISDTLQRVIFYQAAIETNKNAVLIFEEPEVHVFPYYAQFLAESIALDPTNQYFIATHNPYFLASVIEKSKKENINVLITYYKGDQTMAAVLSLDEVEEIMEMDQSTFFNLDQFIEK